MFTRGLRTELPAFVTITGVRVTADLRSARVGVSVFGQDEQIEETMQILKEETWRIRKDMAARVKLKYTPELVFELDVSLDDAEKLEEIFDEIHTRDGNDHAPDAQE